MLTEDPRIYRMHVWMRGIPNDLNFIVEQVDAVRVRSLVLREDPELADRAFVCFRCKDGMRVALGIDDIEMVNYLWEIGIGDQGFRLQSDETATVEIYFRDREQPYAARIDSEPDEDILADLFADLESIRFLEQPFLSFEDEDGEMVDFHAGLVVMVTATPGLVEF